MNRLIPAFSRWNFVRCLVILCLLLPFGLAHAQPAQAADAILYVSPTGVDNRNNCTSERTPCLTIDHALEMATSGDTIELAGGTYNVHLVITKSVTLTFTPPDPCYKGMVCAATLDGTGSGIVVEVAAGVNVTLSNLIIQNGAAAAGMGGGILNTGTLVLRNVTVQNNQASTPSAFGGGIYNNGPLTMMNCMVYDNTSGYIGGGIFNGASGVMTIQTSTISANNSVQNGGGIYNGGVMTIETSNIVNNYSGGSGGGISSYGNSLTITDSQLTNNHAQVNGGGMMAVGGVEAAVDRVTFWHNIADQYGGAVFGNINDANIGQPNEVPHRFVMTNSTLKENEASNGGGVFFYNNFSLANSTITGNMGLNNFGAFALTANANGVFDHMTIYGNTTGQIAQAFSTGGSVEMGAPHLAIRNSIIFGQTDITTCSYREVTNIRSLGRNLVNVNTVDGTVVNDGDTSCLGSATHFISTSDPKLAPLADNGGATQTMALLPGSPANDAALPVDPASDPTTDQRGVTRQNPADIGAYEMLKPASISAAFSPSSVRVGSGSVLQITLTNPNTAPAPLTLSFAFDLPDGLVVGAASGLQNACGGTLTADSGGTAVSISGVSLAGEPDQSSCLLTVPVTANKAGSFQVTLPGVQALETVAGAGTQANLSANVLQTPVSISAAFQPQEVRVGSPTALKITLTNPNPSSSSLTVSFAFNLPEGLVVGPITAPQNTCFGLLKVDGGTAVSLTNGSLAGQKSCVLSLPVIPTKTGDFRVTLPGVQSPETDQGAGTQADLTVRHGVFIPLVSRSQ